MTNSWKRKEVIGNATLPWVRIYALEDEAGNVRYVGKTIRYLHQRHTSHIRAAKCGRLPVNQWLRGQVAKGQRLCIRLLENVPDGPDWIERERHWIARFRQEGARLLNLTNGGEGLHGLKFSDEHKARIGAALRKGRTFPCEVCGTQFWRKPKAIAKGDCRFCSKPCYFVWQKGKTKRMPKHG